SNEQALRRLHHAYDLRPLFAVLPPCSSVPGFLTPLPRAPLYELEAELAVVRATSSERARDEIDRCLNRGDPVDRDVERALRSRDAVERLSRLIEAVWNECVEPWWPRIRDMLERDIRRRSGVFASGGLEAMFEDLEPRIHLNRRHLQIRHRIDLSDAAGG